MNVAELFVVIFISISLPVLLVGWQVCSEIVNLRHAIERMRR